MNARRAAIAAIAVAAACSSAPQGTTAARPGRYDADLITQEQVKSGSFRTAWDAVQATRANWLIVRATVPSTANAAPPPSPVDTATGRAIARATSAEPTRGAPGMNSGIQVYLDGARIGGVDELKRIPAVNVFSIRHLDGRDAQTRFGPGHSNGAILVTTETAKP